MKRLIVSLMVVAGALSSACTEDAQFDQRVGLAGTYDVALVTYPPQQGGDEPTRLLFVTSTDNNELRVISLTEAVAERQFLRAPNPLQPLSIPVLPRPQALTQDVRYDANGAEQSGRLVFARSSGTTLISVVDANREALKEVRRLDTREITQVEGSPVAPAAGPVTAFAARAPEQEGGSTTLYFATQEITGARLWLAQLPARNELGSGAITATPLPGVELPASVAVNSLLVLPNPVGVSHRGVIAVATRGGAGTVFRMDLGTEGGPTVIQELDFGGSQVLQLATHGRVEYREVRQLADGSRTTDPPLVVEAGSRIFGVLDPSNCGVLLQCTGVLAVDVASGRVAKEFSGWDGLGNPVRTYDMLPISAGTGLPTGLSVATDRNLQVAAGEPLDRLDPDPTVTAPRQRGLTLPVLGIVPLSNGTILFFDAARLTHLNTDAIWSETQKQNIATASIAFINALGASTDGSLDIRIEQHAQKSDPAPQEDLTFGVTRDQTYLLTYQGILPEMSAVAIRANDSFQVPFVPRTGKGQVVFPGDLIILLTARTGGQTCATAVPVLSVQAPPAGGTLATLIPSGPLPADCPTSQYSFFQVRAAGPKPLVLSSASEDYIDRVGSGETYEIRGPYFFHPPGYQGQADGVALRFRVTRSNLDDPTGGLLRGERYVISTDAHFFPYLVSVSQVQDLSNFRLPGPVVQTTVGNKDYAYLAYPSANGVLEVDLTAITAGVANSNGLVTYL